jgi:hypothetical protein
MRLLGLGGNEVTGDKVQTRAGAALRIADLAGSRRCDSLTTRSRLPRALAIAND